MDAKEEMKKIMVDMEERMNRHGQYLRAVAELHYKSSPDVKFRKGKGKVEGEVLEVFGDGIECKLRIRNKGNDKEYTMKLATLLDSEKG